MMSKRKHSVSTFQRDWSNFWPCIQPVRGHPDKVQCTVCNSSFGIAHQGKRDVERHLEGSEHKRLAQQVHSCRSLTSFFPDRLSQEKVINAEVLFTGFILEHNLPFEAAAHAGPLFRAMFPDSEIAKKYGCAATKTAAIINYAIAPSLCSPLIEHLQQNPFSLAIDGSSDTGTENMYPLVVRVYNEKTGEICSRFWHMCLVSDSSAAGIFTQVSKVFEEDNVPWQNIIGLSLDNASVNMGRHNGLYRKFEAKNSSVYTFGCPCHIIHNTANHAARAFAGVTGFSVSDFLVDIFYFFDNSTKRQALLKEYCEFCDQDYRKILKFGATRWLSKEVCINRVLRQYPSLRSYFASQPELRSDPRLARLQAYFADPLTEVYLLFLQSILPLFTSLNKVLQSDEPKIHVMLQMIHSFIRKLLGRFMKAAVLTTYADHLAGINVSNHDNYLPISGVMIGFLTQSTMTAQDFLPHEKRFVSEHCRHFMIEAYKYAMSHLPVHDVLLKHAEVIQFEKRHDANFQSLVFKFAPLKAKLGGSMDHLFDQFTDYQSLQDDSVDDSQRIDQIWHHLGVLRVVMVSASIYSLKSSKLIYTAFAT